MDSPDLEDYQRRLDFREGILVETMSWLTNGRRVEVTSRRLVSFSEPDLIAMSIDLVADADCAVEVRSQLVNRQDLEGTKQEVRDPRQAPSPTKRVLKPLTYEQSGLRVLATYVTARSRQHLALGIDHIVTPEVTPAVAGDADQTEIRMQFDIGSGETIHIEKFGVYRADGAAEPRELLRSVSDTLERARANGFDGYARAQERALEGFWEKSDVTISGQPELQQALRWSLFQLIQASARINQSGIPAKGLTSQAYEGHYFWDTEIFMLPFLTFTEPDVTARILRNRHSMLPQARKRAQELSLRGALFPWRTINGEAASAYYPAGTAQYHVSADIVYALRQYVEVSGDEDLLWDVGVEIAVETARLWADLGFFEHGAFHIHMVTGPDEYTVLVNDNAYTNLMARHNLRYAVEVVTRLRQEHADRYRQLTEELNFDPQEIRDWLDAAGGLHVGFDAERGVTAQDNSFLTNEVWDFAGTPPEMYPLLLHFHPLVIYRHQVLKQPDVVLATFLLSEEFTPELKGANFDYYDPLTTGDSSLSASIQSIMAAEVGHGDLALGYFRETAFMDLYDLSGNTADGVHLAAAGGAWMAIVHGFSGLRVRNGELHFDPQPPAGWDRFRFRLLVRGVRLSVDVSPRSLGLSASGGSLEVWVRGERVLVSEDQAALVPLG